MIHTKIHREYCWRTKGYPRVDSDLLMFAASFNRSPSAPELFCLIWAQSIFVKQENVATSLCNSPLRTSKINQIQSPKSEMCHRITFPTALNHTSKNTMWAAALAIHICGSHFPVCNPLEEYFRNFNGVSYHLTITAPSIFRFNQKERWRKHSITFSNSNITSLTDET